MIGCLIGMSGVVLTYAVFRLVVGLGMRDAMVAAWMALYAFVVVVTEGLSFVSLLGRTGILSAWLGLLAAEGLVLWVNREKGAGFLLREKAAWRQWGRASRLDFPVAVWACAALLALTAIYAFLAPNFEPDALSYHLPRVQHWLVNRSIRFYETAIARQNFTPPGFSFVICHVIALMESDRLINFVQWCAYVMSAGVASLIARELGARRHGQCLAAGLSLALPAAISQSYIAVNDQFATVPVLTFTLCLLRTGRGGEKGSGVWAFSAGVSMGLALLTKLTSLVYLAAIAVALSLALLAWVWRNAGVGQTIRLAMMLACVAAGGFSCYVPHGIRNMRAYGDPFSGEPPGMLTNVRLTPRKVAVNMVKHASVHLATPLRAMNLPIERGVARFAGDLLDHADIVYQDPLHDTRFRVIRPLGKATVAAANPVHFILFLMVGSVWLIHARRHFVLLTRCGLPVFAGAVLYCVIFKWQPWSARLQIPLFLLMGAGVAVWLERCGLPSCVRKGGAVAIMVYALLHILLRPGWYMPPFLFGRGSAESGITENMTVGDKIRQLNISGWPKEEIRTMRATVPAVVARGYSLFFTERDRQYLGNETYLKKSEEYERLKELTRFLENAGQGKGYSPVIGLLVSSEHGNIPSENMREPYAYEYLLWVFMRNVTGVGTPRFEHFGLSEPQKLAQQYFGERPGLLISDKSRESVLERLKEAYAIESLFSNRLFTVYEVRKRKGDHPGKAAL